MDYDITNSQVDRRTVDEMTASQITLEKGAELKSQSHASAPSWFLEIEHYLLGLVSLVLIISGLLGMYAESVEIFYVFPYLPTVFADLGYSQEAYDNLFRKTVIVTSAAVIETIYGLALMARMKHLVHRLHIVSGTGLLILSFFIHSHFGDIEDLDFYHRIPEPPSLANITHVRSWPELIELYRRESVEDPVLE